MKKTLIISAASLALLAAPALFAVSANAESAHDVAQAKAAMAKASEQNAPRLFTGEGVIQGNAVYDCEGKYLGSDPDPNVRHSMMRLGSPAACK